MKVVISIFDPNVQRDIYYHAFEMPNNLTENDLAVIWYWVQYIRDHMDTATRITWGQFEYLEILIKEFIKNGKSRLGWMTLDKAW